MFRHVVLLPALCFALCSSAQAADPGYRVDGLVTHQYDLDEWQQGLSTASAGPGAQAVKVTLRPNADVPLV